MLVPVAFASRGIARASVPLCSLELQDDFGRGHAHLSWFLEDGDLAVYQVGTWLVDNVEVGDGTPARYRFCRVDCTQINFTTDCEHGLVRGTAAHIGNDGSTFTLDEEDEIQFGPEQLVARVGASVWQDDEWTEVSYALPPEMVAMAELSLSSSSPPPPPLPPPPSPLPLSVRAPARGIEVRMALECTEENVRQVLEEFSEAASTMFGRHEACARVGITGAIELADLDGPIVQVSLRGRFWHRRETVLRNARAYLLDSIPELCDVELLDPDEIDDTVIDPETGAIIEDRRAPDWNGDRATLTYQGIDPDSRGPFPTSGL